MRLRRTTSGDDPPTLKVWESLSNDELLAEMVRAHAAHETRGPRRRSPRRRAQSARYQLGTRRRSARHDTPIGLGTVLGRGIEHQGVTSRRVSGASVVQLSAGSWICSVDAMATGSYSSLFVVIATSAATLIGLLFVALSVSG